MCPMTSICSVPLVLDASVLINLLATGRLDSILACLGTSAVVVEEVIREVRRDPRDRREHPEILTPFIEKATLTRVSLATAEPMLEHYLDLAAGVGDQDDLGDGEAASIACAIHHRYAVALDERKARAVCSLRYPELQVYSTLDIFRTLEQSGGFRAEHVSESVFDALRFARMRVPHEHEEWVRGLLSQEQLRSCPSLRRCSLNQLGDATV